MRQLKGKVKGKSGETTQNGKRIWLKMISCQHRPRIDKGNIYEYIKDNMDKGNENLRDNPLLWAFPPLGFCRYTWENWQFVDVVDEFVVFTAGLTPLFKLWRARRCDNQWLLIAIDDCRSFLLILFTPSISYSRIPQRETWAERGVHDQQEFVLVDRYSRSVGHRRLGRLHSLLRNQTKNGCRGGFVESRLNELWSF